MSQPNLPEVTDASRIGPVAPPAQGRRHSRKAHIQAMRAVAVLSVIAYHARPGSFSGGFVGVDIFFVISGFLMTRTVSGLADRHLRMGAALREFYVRRATRLLPAALLTVLITCLLVLGLENRLLWRQNFFEALASTGFFENWALAHYSVDYLGAHANSPFQQYWSLSVEEQFYLVWPVIVLSAVLVVRRRGWSRSTIGIPVALIVVASFIYSVLDTKSDPSGSYFNTGVRFWELSIGGLAFLAAPYLRKFTFGGLWLVGGLGLMAYAILEFDGTLPFPGAVASVPVIGSVLVLVFGDFEPVSIVERTVHRLAALPPLQWIGDQSYSLYLLHFPALSIAIVAVFPPTRQVVTPQLTLPQTAVVVAVVFVGAWLLRKFVEDRFRITGVTRDHPAASAYAGTRRLRVRPTWIFILATAAVVVALAGSLFGHANSQYSDAGAALTAFRSADHAACFAAVSTSPAAAASTCTPAKGGVGASTVPSPYLATDDFDVDDCQQSGTRSDPIACHYGSSAASSRRIVLVGDSHTTQWIPAVDHWASKDGYAVTTYLKSGCPLVISKSYNGTCATWNAAVTRLILAEKPMAVIVSARSALSMAAAQEISPGIRAAWAPLLASGIKVIAIRDVPQPDLAGILNMPSCVIDHPSVEACDFKQGKATSADTIGLAAAAQPKVGVVDMSPYICQNGICSGVVGGLLAYVDGSHLSGTFVGALGAAVGRQLDAILAVSGSA